MLFCVSVILNKEEFSYKQKVMGQLNTHLSNLHCIPLKGEINLLLFLKPLQDIAVGLKVGSSLNHQEGMRGLGGGQLSSAVSRETQLHLAISQFFGVTVRYRSKEKSFKMVHRQADQGPIQQPLGILPANKL